MSDFLGAVERRNSNSDVNFVISLLFWLDDNKVDIFAAFHSMHVHAHINTANVAGKPLLIGLNIV